MCKHLKKANAFTTWLNVKPWHVLILCYLVSWGSCPPNWQVRQPCHLLLRFHQLLHESPPSAGVVRTGYQSIVRPHFCDFRRNWTERIQKSGLVLLLVTILRLWCHWGCRAACNRHFERFDQLLADDILPVHSWSHYIFQRSLFSIFQCFAACLKSRWHPKISKAQFHAILWVKIANIIYGFQSSVMSSSPSLLSHLGAILVLSCPPLPTKRITKSSGLWEVIMSFQKPAESWRMLWIFVDHIFCWLFKFDHNS